MNTSLQEKFLTDTDHTGRFLVTSQRTGRTYFVEPIAGKHTPGWGDMDPASKKLTGSYGDKYKGAVDPKESLITNENGFSKIHELGPGVSPLHAIDVIDAAYPDKA
jgi:hypothetical protein